MKKIIQHFLLFVGMVLAYSAWTILAMILLSIVLYLAGYLIIETIFNPGVVVITCDIIVFIAGYYILKSERFQSGLKDLWIQIKWNK
ncbi:MAG: hypothetical protein JNM24_09425 [Bdellovibrionaceae bacterium]|nr:hypothetical protein [Pseudobdellovibrionaceae bacterium]